MAASGEGGGSAGAGAGVAEADMDRRLVGWARAVKSRNARRGQGDFPVLWLFTDSARLADPLPAARALPRGFSGVVFRHDADTEREALGRALASICRERRLLLLVADDARLAVRLGAGLHLRGGRRPARLPPLCRVVSSSVHDRAEAMRARRAGAAVLFISPAFATASHPGARVWGPLLWRNIARATRLHAIALGGIDSKTIRLLNSDVCVGAAAIGALMPDQQASRSR